MRDRPRGRTAAWFGLLAIASVYAVLVLQLSPVNFFGLTEDDTIYFSSARALAEGKGYILPSVPGMPPATKYPILYSWLLSWIWRWDPSFPHNLWSATGLNILFGFGFLAGAWAFLSKAGTGEGKALVLTAFCALHPAILFHSVNLLPEIPFAALCLWAMVSAANAVREGRPWLSALTSGVLSGISVLLRVLGAPITAGLFLVILFKAGWRRSAIFAAGALPFLTGWLWRVLAVPAAHPPLDSSACGQVWRIGWLYYTNYVEFWKADVLASHTFWHMLQSNVVALVLQPGSYFIKPLLIDSPILRFVPALIVSAGVLRGVIWRVGRGKWQPCHAALIFFAVTVAIWNYPAMERFFLPFLPLFVLGLWLECEALLPRLREALWSGGKSKEKPAALFLAGALVILLVGTGWSYWSEWRLVEQKGKERGEFLSEKREAYQWIAEHTQENARVTAYEDGALFLYTGRQSMRPVTFSPSGALIGSRLTAELACLGEGARMIQADYWLVSGDDFEFEWEPAATRGKAAEEELAMKLPEVFSSSGRRVRLLDIKR